MNHDVNSAGALNTRQVIQTEGLRVAIFSDSISERNGTGAYYHDLVRQLAPSVAEIKVFQPKARGSKDILSMPLPGDSTQRLAIPNVVSIRRAIRELRPHIIVSVTPGPFGMLGLWFARGGRSGFISAFHTHFEGLAELYWGAVKRRLIIGTLTRANRFLFRKSSTVLIHNSDLASIVSSLGAPAFEVMGTPLEPSFVQMPPRPSAEGLRQVCFAGRLAAEKNIEAVIEAARQLPQLRFVIGGDGPQRKQVEAAADELDNLSFRGWLDRDGLRQLIDDSDVLVLPSHMETFGSIALEAMARGRPALVSEKAGIHDWTLLSPGLHALRSDETLTDAIVRLQALPGGELKASADQARAVALQLNEETLEQWLSVLSEHALGQNA